MVTKDLAKARLEYHALPSIMASQDIQDIHEELTTEMTGGEK